MGNRVMSVYGINTVVLVNGAATNIPWLNPHTGAQVRFSDQSGADLDPTELIVMRVTFGGTTGNLSITADAGFFTVNSTSVTDTSTVRVVGKIPPPLNQLGQQVY